MQYLSLEQVLILHRLLLEQSGGAHGLRDAGALESAIAQPRMSFDQVDLYPTLAEKAAALAHALVGNHPFVDGNKRAGHAAMETMLVLNGFEINATAEEQERIFLDLAAGMVSRATLADWLAQRLVKTETVEKVESEEHEG